MQHANSDANFLLGGEGETIREIASPNDEKSQAFCVENELRILISYYESLSAARIHNNNCRGSNLPSPAIGVRHVLDLQTSELPPPVRYQRRNRIVQRKPVGPALPLTASDASLPCEGCNDTSGSPGPEVDYDRLLLLLLEPHQSTPSDISLTIPAGPSLGEL